MGLGEVGCEDADCTGRIQDKPNGGLPISISHEESSTMSKRVSKLLIYLIYLLSYMSLFRHTELSEYHQC
jgi:hypothetical protein